MRICLVASEVAPFAKTGGLGDVCGALTRYLAAAGHDVRTFLPLYGNVKPSGATFRPVEFLREVPVPVGGRTLAFSGFTAPLPRTNVPVYFVGCSPLYGRAETYSGRGDEHERFAYLSRAALEACQRMGFAPDVVHAHDWHAALLPVYLRRLYGWDRLFARTRTLLTVHNVGYQGTFPSSALADVGLAGHADAFDAADLAAGRFSFLKTGIVHADAISTVSVTHAREMTTPEHGMGLDPWLRARARDFVGIANGIDADLWNPATDPALPAHFTADDLAGKAHCRARLLAERGLVPDPSGPVFGVVTRLTAQKGIDLLEAVLPEVLATLDARVVALGAGEPRLARFLHGLARAHPGKASFQEGYDDALAHRIEAGADAFLMPSRFEPCGLNQMYSQRYGTLPVVRRTGGLADTVDPIDVRTGAGTGFVFEHHTADGLRWALSQALALWRAPDAWRRAMRTAMSRDFSWDLQVGRYVDLYRRLAG